jgi:hypothetical protein
MLRFTLLSFATGWLLVILIAMTGHLAWDNKLLWGPIVLFMLSTMLGLTGLDDDEHRAPLLLLAALSFGSTLVYALFYVFFVFGMGGY